MNDAYPKFGSIPRLNRDMVITEKIDGTNGLIFIYDPDAEPESVLSVSSAEGDLIAAGSRNRWLTVSADNFGFAAWVSANADSLRADLGPGMHYGEWWGSGIQRGYGLPSGQKRFSLFNTKRWAGVVFTTPSLGVVPVLDRYTFSLTRVNLVMEMLRTDGSKAQPGFMNPEGVVVYHAAANQMFKATLENDEKPKSAVA